MRTTRITLVALACLALAMAGCGGGGPEPSAGPVTPLPATSTSATSPGPAPGGGAAVGTFRACHKHRNGSLVLIMLFENRDRSLVGGFAGALAYRVEASEPATWRTTGDPVTVDPGVNEHVRQITVPTGEPAPSEVTLSVTTTAAVDATNVLATNDVTIPVPASACSSG
jgi:predicted small lipoprotein YifL